MAAASKTKTARKSAPRAKSGAAKAKTNASGNKRGVKSDKVAARPASKSASRKAPERIATSDRDKTGAEKATAMMRKNTDGKRAPVNATQVALVRGVVGRRSLATVSKEIGFTSMAQLKRHASGELATEDRPDGVARGLVEFSAKLTGSGASKIRGRKLTAILASL